jgi:hypothetical protein
LVGPGITVEDMSDPTDDARVRAEEVLAAEQTKTERLERELLDRIATGVPTAVDGIAKRAAESQPEVTRQLGSDGIRAMRAELAERAIQLATEIRAAQISWPFEQSARYGEVATRHLDAALFSYLHGPRMDALVEVLQGHGFAASSDGEDGAQDLINPHDLYNERWLAPLAEAGTTQSLAESRVRAADQSDDDAAVRSIWDRSQQ